MRRGRPGPVLLAGAATVAGDVAGLLLSGGAGPPPGLLLAAAALAALPALASAAPGLRRAVGVGPTPPDAGDPAGRRRDPLLAAPPRGRPVPLLLAACALAGLSLGLRAGRAARGSCLARLDAGADVRVAGRVVRDVRAPPATGASARGGVPDAPGRSSVRVELAPARIASAQGACRVPGVLARVPPPPAPLEAGAGVAISGRWIRFDGGEARARPLDRYGMVRGRLGGAPERRRGPGGAAGDGAPRAGPAAREVPAAGPLARLAVGLRAAASRRLRRRVPGDVAELAEALVLADRAGLEPRLARSFADAGLAHLLAISGLHVGLLAGGILWLLGRVSGRRARYLWAALLTGAYVLLIGAPPAASRAAVLFAGWAAARYRGAPVRATELLGAAAAVALLADPRVVAAAGFQLSFAGFAGLLLGDALAGRLTEGLRARGRNPGRRARAAVAALAAGTGAFALTSPLAALHFQRTAPMAVASNFAGVPLVTLALAGLAGALALPGPLAGLAADAAAAALRLLVGLVDALSSLPWGHGAVAPPGPVFWVGAAALLAAAVVAARGAPLARAAVPAGLAAAAWIGGPALSAPGGGRALLCQLDVGQGDAAALRTRRGHWAVFDAGPRFGSRDAGLSVVTPFLRDRGARSVSLFVLSHPHLDHVGGAGALFRTFRVDRVLDAGNPAPSGPYAEFLDAVREEGASWLPAVDEARLRLDGVEITVLGPDAGGGALWEGGAREANEASVAVRVRIGEGFVYLNTGDASVEQEAAILARWPRDSLRAILLKVGHHGSRTASSSDWLEAVRPSLAVISAGPGNRYGHPHRDALRRLERAGVPRVWRTDRQGTLCVEVREDGSWRVRGEPGWRPGLAGTARSGARHRERATGGDPWTDPSSR